MWLQDRRDPHGVSDAACAGTPLVRGSHPVFLTQVLNRAARTWKLSETGLSTENKLAGRTATNEKSKANNRPGSPR